MPSPQSKFSRTWVVPYARHSVILTWAAWAAMTVWILHTSLANYATQPTESHARDVGQATEFLLWAGNLLVVLLLVPIGKPGWVNAVPPARQQGGFVATALGVLVTFADIVYGPSIGVVGWIESATVSGLYFAVSLSVAFVPPPRPKPRQAIADMRP